MKSFVRLGLCALMCVALGGCAWASWVVSPAALSGHTIYQAIARQTDREHWLAIQCQAFSAKGIVVTQSLGMPIPTDEGNVISFEVAHGEVQFASEGFPQVERAVIGTSGTFVITERSVALATSPDTTGVRIPFELIANVEIERNYRTGLPHAVIVESYCGRFDVFTFSSQQDPIKRDPELIKTVAAQLNARLAVFHATTGSASKVQNK